jgi:hypothetical protein
MNPSRTYRSIFASSTARQRAENFEDYWRFTRAHSGDLLEAEKDLTQKRAKLAYFRDHPVQLRCPFADAETFYRNYVRLQDPPHRIGRKTLLLTCIYKFARHEWVGISGAWDATPSMADAVSVTDKISRYHLAEEFCHIRFFHEMFRTFGLEAVEWVPLGAFQRSLYEVFPRLPEKLMSPLAFVTELMGITFYQEVDAILDDVFADEPEARDRLRALLHEITVDEVAHIGQRRNYLGAFGMRVSAWLTPLLFRAFFRDIPETKHLFDVEKMIRDGLGFDYGQIPSHLMGRTWVPSYCQ